MRSKFKWILALIVAFTMQFSFAQQKTIKGVVSDANGPLPSANVLVKGTSNGTTADFDGKYAISAKQGDILVFSFVGMAEAEVAVGASNEINVVLEEGMLLPELVVTALGITKRPDEVTSSFTQVSSEAMAAGGNPDAVRSLAGKVAGLQINNTSNGVSGSTSILLRTQISFSKSNEALVVIDGIPTPTSVFAAMPPSMIESVNVIKGSQGAALYGSQGVNGVLIVTTKKGSEKDKVTVTFNSAIDFEEVAFTPEKQTKYGQGWDGAWDRYENGAWGDLMDGSIRPVGITLPDGSEVLAPYSARKDNTKEFYKGGTIVQNGVSINLTSGKSYVSFSADNQLRDFINKGDESKRSNFLLRAGTKSDRWNVNGSFNYRVSNVNQSDPAVETLFDLIQSASNIPISEFENRGGLGGWNIYYNNPYFKRDNNRLSNNINYFNTGINTTFKVNKNISIGYNGSMQSTNRYQKAYANALVEDSNPELVGSLGQASQFYRTTTNNNTYYGDLMVNFDYSLTDDLKLKATLGHNMQNRVDYRMSQGGQNLEIPGFYEISNVLNPDSPSRLLKGDFTDRSTAEFVNVDLGYKDYLNLNITSRYEHVSKLLPANRDFFYPSIGASFIPTRLTDLTGAGINYLKIYGNYTKVGSIDALRSYQVLNYSSLAPGFPFPGGGNSYADLYSAVDPNITPEYYSTIEAGFTVAMFKDKISLDVAAFQTKTSNAISDIEASRASGIQTTLGNIGDILTKGIDVTLSYNPIKNDNFQWNGNINFGAYKNEITRLAGGERVTLYNAQNNQINGAIVAQLGESFPYLVGTDWLRDPNGNVIVNATTGRPTVNPVQQKLGKVNPDYTIGLTNNIAYKGLGLSFTTDYRKGGKIFSEAVYASTWAGHAIPTADYDRDLGFIYPGSVTETAPNSGVFVPNTTVYTAVGTAGANGARAYSGELANLGAYNALDATFLKVREIALSYSLPAKFTDKIGVTSLKMSINARNPFIVLADDNLGYTDPEASSQYNSNNANAAKGGVNNDPVAAGLSEVSQFPSTRTFGFSLNVGF